MRTRIRVTKRGRSARRGREPSGCRTGVHREWPAGATPGRYSSSATSRRKRGVC
jgi:hypothetical protein